MANQAEQSEKWIERFTDLQRIKDAKNRDYEIEYQLSIAKAQLEALGIPTENLVRKEPRDE
ncbi:MAG: hypothetical protein IJ679_00745 [Lachnospiraceae bacterium]|nr:hypothetical protein [Lachnospiraceae bacterium]